MHNEGGLLPKGVQVAAQSSLVWFQHSGQNQKALETSQELFQDQGQRQRAEATTVKYPSTQFISFSSCNYI